MKITMNFGLAALLICAASVQWSGVASGQTMKFFANRSVGIHGHETEQLTNEGASAAGALRAQKTSQDALILDFDTDAMGSFLAENPGMTATWTLGITVKDFINSNGGPNFANDIEVLSVESTNDWVQGNGSSQAQGNFNWSQGQFAATYFYAATRYFGAGTSQEIDAEGSREWFDPDSGPYTFTSRTPDYASYASNGLPDGVGGNGANPTPDFTNSVAFTAQELWENWAFGNTTNPALLQLDNNLVNAMINDENNRGIRFGPLVNQTTSNWRIYNEDQSSALDDLKPYIEVTLSPFTGLAGDFDEDGDVDGNDFLVWQRDPNVGSLTAWQSEYGQSAPLSAAIGSVPEPSSLLLISMGSLLALGRRRSRS